MLQFQLPPLPQLIMVGHTVWRPGDQHFSRTFNVYDLLLVRKGTLYMTEDDAPYSISENDLLLLEPGLRHYGHKPCEEDTEIYWLHFVHPLPTASVQDRQVPWTSIAAVGTDQDPEPRQQSFYLPKWANIDARAVLPLLDAMLETQEKLITGSAIRLQSLFIQVLEQLQGWAWRSSSPSRSRRLSEQIEVFLRRYIREPFRAEELSRHFHFHADYLARCLKKHTGMTPLQYVHYLKLEEAKKLLRSGSLPVPLVAERAGFGDYNYFIRIFRQKTGTTPGEYRRNAQGLM